MITFNGRTDGRTIHEVGCVPQLKLRNCNVPEGTHPQLQNWLIWLLYFVTFFTSWVFDFLNFWTFWDFVFLNSWLPDFFDFLTCLLAYLTHLAFWLFDFLTSWLFWLLDFLTYWPFSLLDILTSGLPTLRYQSYQSKYAISDQLNQSNSIKWSKNSISALLLHKLC